MSRNTSFDPIAPLIVLHGANGSAADMAPLLERLGDERPVLALNMLGHGGREVPDALSLEALGNDAIAQCDAAGIGQAHWFGYSVGGLVALWVAAHHPKRVLSVATLTAKIVYDRKGVDHALHLTDAARVARGNPARPGELQQMHAPQDWLQVLGTVRRMFLDFAQVAPMSEADFAGIAAPVLAFGAMDDPLVPVAEVRRLAALVPHGTPAVFPGTAHPLVRAPLETIVRTLQVFHANPGRLRRSASASLREFRWDRRL